MQAPFVFGPNTNGLKCTLATGIAGCLPPARKWHPALMLTYQRRRRHGPRSRVGPAQAAAVVESLQYRQPDGVPVQDDCLVVVHASPHATQARPREDAQASMRALRNARGQSSSARKAAPASMPQRWPQRKAPGLDDRNNADPSRAEPAVSPCPATILTGRDCSDLLRTNDCARITPILWSDPEASTTSISCR